MVITVRSQHHTGTRTVLSREMPDDIEVKRLALWLDRGYIVTTCQRHQLNYAVYMHEQLGLPSRYRVLVGQGSRLQDTVHHYVM